MGWLSAILRLTEEACSDQEAATRRERYNQQNDLPRSSEKSRLFTRDKTRSGIDRKSDCAWDRNPNCPELIPNA